MDLHHLAKVLSFHMPHLSRPLRRLPPAQWRPLLEDPQMEPLAVMAHQPKELPNHLNHHHGSPRPHHSMDTLDNQRSHMDIMAFRHTRIATTLSRRPHHSMDTSGNRLSHTDILAFRRNHHHRSPCGKNRINFEIVTTAKLC